MHIYNICTWWLFIIIRNNSYAQVWLNLTLLIQEEKKLQDSSYSSGTMRALYPVGDLVNDMTSALIAQWHKANVDFEFPVVIGDKSIKRKLQESWATVQNIAWKRVTKRTQIDTFEAKLDELVDITKCNVALNLVRSLTALKSVEDADLVSGVEIAKLAARGITSPAPVLRSRSCLLWN